jgi:hypothetical protein
VLCVNGVQRDVDQGRAACVGQGVSRAWVGRKCRRHGSIEPQLEQLDTPAGHLEHSARVQPAGRMARGSEPGAGAGGQIDTENASAVQMQVNVPRADGTVFNEDVRACDPSHESERTADPQYAVGAWLTKP